MLTAGGLRNACPTCRARILGLTSRLAGAPLPGRAAPSSYPRQSTLAASKAVVRPIARRHITTTSPRLQDSDLKKPDSEALTRATDIETVVREAKQRFRDTLPKGYLSEEEYRLYERWYGPPLRETTPEDVGIEYLNEKQSEARVREDGSAEPALLRQGEGGSYEEVVYARKRTSDKTEEVDEDIVADEVTQDISTEVEQPEEVTPEGRENYIDLVARNRREYDALMKLQKDFEAHARLVEETSRAQEDEEDVDEEREYEDEERLDEDDDGIQAQGISNRAGRLHPLTREGHFSTNPSTVSLPYVGYISPVTKLLGRTDIKHVQDAAEKAFGGPGLPYSPATPASKLNLPQQPVGMAVWQARMSEIDADAFVSTFLPPVYASAMGSLVETRKRLGTDWFRNLFKRGDGEGPRVLDVGGGGAGLLAWQDVVRAEWDAMKTRGEVTASRPPGKQSVVVGAEKLRQRVSKFLQNTSFLPRLPDYRHSVENQQEHIDANATPQPRKMYDVIIASHLMLPVQEGHRRKAILNNIWSLLNPNGGVLILLEKGQPRGFEAVAEARDRLLSEFLKITGVEEMKTDEEAPSPYERVKEDGRIIAPCTNHRTCPMYLTPGKSKGRKDFCHFSQRFVRPQFLQKILGATHRNHDDVLFSYVSIQRGVAAKESPAKGDEATESAFEGFEDAETEPDMLSLPRQILPPIKRRGHVTLDVCTPAASIERWTIPKSFSKQAYHDARKAKWGDLWALGAKTRMRRNVRLGRPEVEDDGGIRAQRAKAAGSKKRKVVEVPINESGVIGNPDAVAQEKTRRNKGGKKAARDELRKQMQNM
ncbi:putative S-adenosyl-L-methionine-dependent RNA methyltransferase RSM22 [Colletotrichum spinosum]|uniref:Putative S-adenosyl-L-methionine-dependent RNA methyltransferase RSM22 n=1 Tax=Colletotrichum spinosum TaxID=1347390 RepID=A0A4R8QA20_9PEZI|nr:putative S-adenosyl-L-methionine-dependent RNA methyltransferase RSM22 [Colletotrichum spinosum]